MQYPMSNAILILFIFRTFSFKFIQTTLKNILFILIKLNFFLFSKTTWLKILYLRKRLLCEFMAFKLGGTPSPYKDDWE